MMIGRMRLWWRWWRVWVRLLFLLLYRGRVSGARFVPVDGGVLLLANHQSFFDPMLATLAPDRETGFMARDSLFRRPAFAWAIRSLNAFPVRRWAADVAAIKETLRRLKAGQAVLLFPEGTRTPDGTIKPFEQGVVMLAKRTGVPIVPVLIDGAFEVWPRDRKLPSPRGRIRVQYGRPIGPGQIAATDPAELVELIRRRLTAMQTRFRTRLGLPLYHDAESS